MKDLEVPKELQLVVKAGSDGWVEDAAAEPLTQKEKPPNSREVRGLRSSAAWYYRRRQFTQ
jgi:hypothetical protein